MENNPQTAVPTAQQAGKTATNQASRWEAALIMKTRASFLDQTSIFFQVIIDQAALSWVNTQHMAEVGPVWSLISQAI